GISVWFVILNMSGSYGCHVSSRWRQEWLRKVGVPEGGDLRAIYPVCEKNTSKGTCQSAKTFEGAPNACRYLRHVATTAPGLPLVAFHGLCECSQSVLVLLGHSVLPATSVAEADGNCGPEHLMANRYTHISFIPH
uniref:Uncharacterized protein n=1 Tax=Salvator merianae TaxID=96440 RepID=A0A8D0DSV9_SALMN